MPEYNNNRTAQLDGLRGVAAVVVVLSHAFCAFKPSLAFGTDYSDAPSIAASLSASPLFLFINGSFAVCIFMVLSGYVITASAERVVTPLILRFAARYVRLSIPAGVAVLFATALILTNGMNMVGVSELIPHWWVKIYYRPEDFLWTDIFSEVGGKSLWTGRSYLVPVLWIMQLEFFGSCAVFGLCALLESRSHRLIAYPFVIYCTMTNMQQTGHLCMLLSLSGLRCATFISRALRLNVALHYSP